MTNAELSDFIGNPPPGTITVRMSKDGFFLITEGLMREISGDQAEILFEAMPLMMKARQKSLTNG